MWLQFMLDSKKSNIQAWYEDRNNSLKGKAVYLCPPCLSILMLASNKCWYLRRKKNFVFVFLLFTGFILFLIDVAPIYARQQEIQYSGLVWGQGTLIEREGYVHMIPLFNDSNVSIK